MLSDTELTDFLSSGAFMEIGEGRLLIGWGSFQRTAHCPKDCGPAFYAPDFRLEDSNSWYHFKNYITYSIEDLLKVLPIPNEITAPRWQSPDLPYFFQTFNDLMRKFENSTLQKAVPVSFTTACCHMDRDRLSANLHHLLSYILGHNVHAYGFWNSQEGILGASPEILFKIKKETLNTVHTMACAGTYPVNADPQKLLQDKKERLEHQLVVNGICDSLTSLGKVNIALTTILQLPQLIHLATSISLELKEKVSFETLVHALHPTPALGAFPKEEGWDWIKNYQTEIPRKRFGAPFGCIYEGSSNCLVAIRNVQWDTQKMQIGAGCGIVAESVFTKEWDEMQRKIGTVKTMLGEKRSYE